MRRRAYKHVSYWLASLKPSICSKRIEKDNMEEYVSLTDLRNRKGQIKIQGPDGALSWLVAIANFVVNFIIVGLGRMSGILYVEFMYLFDVDRKTASIPFSIQQAGRNLFGPVAGILGQKYGLRFVTILGGVIGSFSAGAAFYKMDITSMTLLWGLLFGLSTALTTTLSQISIDQYFDKHRATAGGFAFSGGCLGAFIFPVILEILIDRYEMRGTFLILGSIILFVVPAAIAMVEPPWQLDSKPAQISFSKYGSIEAGTSSSPPEDNIEKIKANNRQTQCDEIKSVVTEINFMALRENSDMVFQYLTFEMPGPVLKTTQPDLKNFNKKRLLKEMECIYASLTTLEKKLDSESSELITSSDSKMKNSAENPIVRYEVHESMDNKNDALKIPHDIPRSVYIHKRLKELFEARGVNLVSHFPYWEQSRAWKILVELRKLYETLNDKQYLKTIYKNVGDFRPSKPKAINIKQKKRLSTNHSNSFFSHISTAVKMHTNPIFLLICLCRGVFMLTFIPVVTIIVDFAMDQGLPKTDGKYIIATMSFGDLLGRLCLGWVTDRNCLSLPRYMLLVMLLLGGSTASLPFMVTKATLFPSVLVFGILQGSLFVRHPLLVTQYMKKHEQAIGMGFINFLSGFLGFALPAFIGYFRDTIGSYDKMFYLNGIICGAVGLIWILEPLFQKICSDITDNNKGKQPFGS